MPVEPKVSELRDPEDRKIVTLARAARARIGAAEGACVRDTDGRTYAGATVALDSLRLTALQVAVAMAVSSGAPGIEAVAVLGDAPTAAETDVAVIRDLAGAGVPFYLAAPDGSVIESLTT